MGTTIESLDKDLKDLSEINKQTFVTNEEKKVYNEEQHKELLKHIGVEDVNFFVAIFFTLGLGATLFWQVIQMLNIVQASEGIRKLEEPMIFVLMGGLVAIYFYQKYSLKNSEFIDIINKKYYVHKVSLISKNMNIIKDSFDCEIEIEGYDGKFQVNKDVYDKLTMKSSVDVIYSESNEILYMLPSIL